MTSRAQRVFSAALLILPPGGLPAEEDAAAAVARLEEELNTALMKCDAASLDRLWDDEMTCELPLLMEGDSFRRVTPLVQDLDAPRLDDEELEGGVADLDQDVPVGIALERRRGAAGQRGDLGVAQDGKGDAVQILRGHVSTSRAYPTLRDPDRLRIRHAPRENPCDIGADISILDARTTWP